MMNCKWMVGLATFAGLALAACTDGLVTGEEDPGSPAADEDVIIPETTRVLAAEGRAALVSYDQESGTLRFNRDSAGVAPRSVHHVADPVELEPGDVLVSEPAAAAPYGLLRRVTDVVEAADGAARHDPAAPVGERLSRRAGTGQDHRMQTLPDRAAFPLLRSLQTRWHDNDHYGHVNNVVYYSYFDTAVNGWLIEASGQDVRELSAIGLVAETSCRYLRPVRFPDALEVGLAVTRLGRTSVGYSVALFLAGDEGVAAVGRFVHVYVDRQHRRPIEIPAELRAVLEPVHESSARLFREAGLVDV